jgi:CTP:phosphocholine cytidylyltransferase-like protein/thiamine kinase-like enzyme
MINYKEFEVLKAIIKGCKCEPSTIFSHTKYSTFRDIEEIQNLIKELEQKGYLLNGQITKSAFEEIEPCRVKNAVILAAGGSDVSAKSVYSMPKGLFKKNGETLIEREIRQLKEVGINDITVVIGYKQELYFFLEDKWGVTLEINPDLKKNNLYSLYVAKEHLSSTYICNCDNYFVENPFSAYEYNSYHATIYKEDAHNELLVRKNESGRLLSVYSGAKEGECLYGHAFFDSEFSKTFKRFMENEISDFRVSALFWEEFVSRHVEDLNMYIHKYPETLIYEFDAIQEIQDIDGLFLGSVSGRINGKICEVLNCNENDIKDISILEKGLTNILFTFYVHGKHYIFRYPGDSSSFFIYRKNECMAQKLASISHADDTCIYIDESGIKISIFRENCHDLHRRYYHDIELMKSIARKIRSFHVAGYDLPNWEEYDYDPVYQCERLFKEASKTKGNLFDIFKDEWTNVRLLKKYADMDGIKHTMCHNDINIDNILETDNTLDIIDWEFAGYNDPGYDFGRVIAGLDYKTDDPAIMSVLEAYFGRPATETEHLHWMAYSAIHNWYYVGWSLYKESINESSRDWMLFFYEQTKKLLAWCLPKYEKKYGKINK